MALQLGETLGRYRLEEAVGQGGMAVVYRAVDTVLGRTVAVKVIRPAFTEDQQFLERFLQEARLVASLDHPNILPVFDFGEHHGNPYLVLPYLRGGTLASRLQGRPQPLPQVAAWLVQLAGALDAAHARGVLHRDIKPGNVLVGGDGRLVLGDFGIARLAEASTRLTATGMVVGTPLYMAPELARGADAGPASDRYALAVMAYEMVAGQPPFVGSNPLSVLHQQVNEPVPAVSGHVPDVPRGVDAWLQGGLAKDPAGRPASARALAEELVQLLTPDQRAELSTLVWTGGSELRASAGADAPTVVTPGRTLVPERPSTSAGTRRALSPATAATAFATPVGRRRGVVLGWSLAAIVVVAATLLLGGRRLLDASPAAGDGAAAAVAPAAAPAATVPVGPPVPPTAAEPPPVVALPGVAVPTGEPAGGALTAPAAPAAPGDADGGEAATAAAPPPAAAPAFAQSREALALLRRPASRFTEAGFAAVEAGARGHATDPRFGAALGVAREWARGGAAYAAGREEDAERSRQALLSTIAAAPAAAPWGIAWPALVFQREDPALARAALYTDARRSLQPLVAGQIAAEGGRLGAALAMAHLRHLEGDHAGAVRVLTGGGIDPAALPDSRARALTAQLLMAEAMELGDAQAVRRWRPMAVPDGGAPLARPFMVEMAGLARQTLTLREAAAVAEEACRVGVTQLCRGAQPQAMAPAEPATRAGRQPVGPRRRRPPGDGGRPR